MGPRAYLILLLLVGIVNAIQADNPGVKMRMTEKAIRYLETIVGKQISYIVERLKIKDVEGKLDNIGYNITNINIRNVTNPKIRLELIPGNSSSGEIRATAKNLSLLLTADYMTYYDLVYGRSSLGIRHLTWHYGTQLCSIEVPLTGSVGVQFGQANIDIKMTPTSSPELNYLPLPRSLYCNVNIENLDVSFTGDLQWILNMLQHLFKGTIKSTIQDQICYTMMRVLEERGAAKTRDVRLISTFADVFVIDYSHIAPIVITKHYLEGQHLGEVYWKNGRKASPFVASELPEFPEESSKMIYVMLSEYTAKTLAYTAHTENYLQYALAHDTILPTVEAPYQTRDRNYCIAKEEDFSPCLQESLSDYLRTTCPENLCIGSIIKQVGQRYPNTHARVVIKSIETPDIVVKSDHLAVTLYGDVQLDVKAAPDVHVSALSLQVVLILHGTGYLREGRASANITQYSAVIKNVKSLVDSIDESSASDLISSALDVFIIPQLKKVASYGLPLPYLNGVKHENVSLTLLNGAVLISTDVSVSENEYLSLFP